MRNEFKIFKSSAGSGKTYTLVKEYLRLVLNNPDEYKHILALTFTNKATDEMKTRIVESLIRLSKNEDENLKKVLSAELKKTDITERAGRALDKILHDYGNFSISTIDRFFNRVIRSLAREIHLPLRLEVQLDEEEVIREISNDLFLQLREDKELLEWLTELAIGKIADDKGWNVENEIMAIAKEMFRENALEEKPHSRKEIRAFYNELREIKSGFENQMKSFGSKGMKAIEGAGLEIKDFSHGNKGVANYFNKIRMNIAADKYVPGKLVKEAAEDVSKWASQKSPKRKAILSLAENTLQPLLNEIIEYHDSRYPVYLGAIEVLKRIFLLGIVEDLKKRLAVYREEKSMLLISETPKILNKFINEEDTPFIYEKSGNRYHHFLVDEFQDTSSLQWKNLLPLVINALGIGHFAMVVGDVKQSIYRWRSGNMHLLDSQVERDLHRFRSLVVTEHLDTNYRSKETIVRFNNAFFKTVPGLLTEVHELEKDGIMTRAYAEDAAQKIVSAKKSSGRVELCTMEKEEKGDEETKWKNQAMVRLLEKMNELIAIGYRYEDIAILVRKNEEGDFAARWLIEKGITEVVSPDSLLLINAPETRFLLNVLLLLEDNNNTVARSEVLNYWLTWHPQKNTSAHSVFSDATRRKTKNKKAKPALFEAGESEDSLFGRSLPPEFTGRMQALARLPMVELIEQLISLFSLPKDHAYVVRFQEMILEFSSKQDASIRSFLDWWNESNAEETISIVTSESANAIRIMSIHKSKGLQFPVVFIPFADWSLLPSTKDVLWIESDVAPFSRFGKIPVQPNKALGISCFADSYHSELSHSITDNINMLYVAFTRAEEELYIFFPASASTELNSTGKLLRMAIEKNPDWGPAMKSGGALVLGEHSPARRESAKSSIPAFNLTDFKRLKWNEKIRLSLKSDELMEMLDNPVKRAINYGVLVHGVLASIRTIHDVQRAVDSYHAQGLLDEDEKEKLLDEISGLLSVPEIAGLFDGSSRIMNEQEIILPDGQTVRPDRVLLKGNKAIVIDFKTGAEHPAHHKQLNRYSEVLEKMDYESIDKYLVYIGEKRILRVI